MFLHFDVKGNDNVWEEHGLCCACGAVNVLVRVLRQWSPDARLRSQVRETIKSTSTSLFDKETGGMAKDIKRNHAES